MLLLLLGVLQEPRGILGGGVLLGVAQPASHTVLYPVGAMAVAQEEMVGFAAVQEGALAWGGEARFRSPGNRPKEARGLSKQAQAVPLGPYRWVLWKGSRGAALLGCHLLFVSPSWGP